MDAGLCAERCSEETFERFLGAIFHERFLRKRTAAGGALEINDGPLIEHTGAGGKPGEMQEDRVALLLGRVLIAKRVGDIDAEGFRERAPVFHRVEVDEEI